MGKFRSLRYLPLLFCAVVMARTLLFSPAHGVADNGDFWRVMLPAGIRYPTHPASVQYRYVQTRFHLQKPELEKTTTSAVAPALLARLTAEIFGTTFDLRVLGALYLALFLSGLCLLLGRLRSWTLAFAVAWISSEPTLFLHFNSFYSVVPHLALWPWLLWALNEVTDGTLGRPLDRMRNEAREQRFAAPVLFLSSLLLTTSKAQFVPIPLLLALILFLRRRRLAYTQLAVFTLALVSLLAYPAGIRLMNDYQATFTGPGLVADDPARALKKLGVPEEALAWNGRSLPPELMKGQLPDAVRHAAENVSRVRLLETYLTEPGAFRGALARVQESLARWPLGYLGHFEASTEREGEELRFPWQYSRWRDPVLLAFPWLLWLVPAAALALACRAPLLAFLASHFFTQLPLTVLGDGLMALQRHYLVSRLCWDLMAWMLVALGVDWAIRCLQGKHEGEKRGPPLEDSQVRASPADA